MPYRKIFFAVQYIIFCNLILLKCSSPIPLIGHNIRKARENEFPFIVGLTKRVEEVDKAKDILCTGVAFTKKHVLTAAHCVHGQSFKSVQMIIGSIDITSRKRYYPAWWLTYDEWNELKNIRNGFTKNDINVIRLTEDLPDDSSVAQILYLPNKKIIGGVVTVGWGEINSGVHPNLLHMVDLNVLSTEACETKITKLNGEPLYIDKNILCTDADPFSIMMRGDSGGPLLYNNTVVGINYGTCPLAGQWFHPDKVNLHTSLSAYECYITDIVDNF